MNSNFLKAIGFAPWTVFPIVFISTLTIGRPDEVAISQGLSWAFWYGITAVLVAYIGILVYGIPSLLLLKRIGWFGFRQVLLVGILGPLLFTSFSINAADWSAFIYAGVCGGAVACTAWYLYKRKTTQNQ